MSLYEALARGHVPWTWRLGYWWRHTVLRRPKPKGEMGSWEGVRFSSPTREGKNEA